MLKLCLNLPAGHCIVVVQAVKALLEPSWCWNLPVRHCVVGVQVFKRWQNLSARHCVAGLQAV